MRLGVESRELIGLDGKFIPEMGFEILICREALGE